MSEFARRRIRASLWLVLACATTAASHRVLTAAGAAEQGQPAPARVAVLIGFDLAPDLPEEALVRSVGGEIRYRFHLVRAIAARVPPQAVAALRANPRVTRVEPDVRVSAVDTELDDSWGVRRIGSGAVHQSGVWGAGVAIAVLDSGIDTTHPDLALNYGGGYDFVNQDDDPADDNSHGSHVSGILAARDDDAGVVGVAPQATIYALKVLDANGYGLFSDVVAALQWVVDRGIPIANHSYGSLEDPGDIVRQAFDNAEAAGTLNVAAAGNSGTCAGTGDNVGFPARYESVLAVAATDAADLSPCFSSTGPAVELSAPGVDVNSTVPGGYQLKSGTSMSSPHVAGVAALVVSQGLIIDANGNGRINDDVRQQLVATAQDLGAPGRDTWYGYGLVDAVAATGTTVPRDPSVAVVMFADKGNYLQGVDASAMLTAVVKDENGADIAGLTPSQFSVRVDGGAAAVQFAPAADGRYVGPLPLAPLAAGSHGVDLVVTDARGISGTSSTSFTLSPSVKAQSIAYALSGPANKPSLSIAVTVVDPATGATMRGATVAIHLAKNGVQYYGLSATSNRNGVASFTIKNAPSACYVTTIAGIQVVGRIWDQTTPPNQYCY